MMNDMEKAKTAPEAVRGAEWPGFSRGMGIGGWLTNYKRFNVLPEDKRLLITEGDLEHFDSYITEAHPGKILWNGEFGTIRHADPACRLAYMRDVIAICREWGIPYCVWNYLSTPNDGNRFSLVDDDTRKLLIPVFSDPFK